MRPTRAYTAYWSGLDYTRTCRGFSHKWAGSLLCLETKDEGLSLPYLEDIWISTTSLTVRVALYHG